MLPTQHAYHFVDPFDLELEIQLHKKDFLLFSINRVSREIAFLRVRTMWYHTLSWLEKWCRVIDTQEGIHSFSIDK